MGKKQPITKNLKPLPDQDVLSKMTVARLCGLLQTDGCFSLVLERSKGTNGKIILTHSNKDGSWVVAISDWLKLQGISNSIPAPDNKKWLTSNVTSINITIDRAQAKKLIQLILDEEARLGTPLLFDKKRENMLLVKKALELREANNSLGPDKQLLNNIKVFGIKKYMTPKGKFEDYKNRLNISNATEAQLKDAGVAEIQTIKQEANDIAVNFLKKMAANRNNINPVFGEFMAGVIDGDGSILVSLQADVEDGDVVKNRNAFKISPQITLTDAKFGGKKTNLFKLFCLFFNKYLGYVSEPSSNSERLAIKDLYTLKTYVVPFLNKTPLTVKKNLIRFKTFKYVLEKMSLVYQDKEAAKDLIRYIYSNDLNPEKRKRNLDEYLQLVELEFNKPDKKN